MVNHGPRSLLDAETVYQELINCNPTYALVTAHIIAPSRWMRTNEELRTTLRSSLIFAVDDEDTAKGLLQGNTLTAFTRYCPLRTYQDRPPVKQCKNCWGLDHTTLKCKEPPRCHLCAGEHKEEDHNVDQECSKCKALEVSDDMELDKSSCTHNLHCTNCSTATHITDKKPSNLTTHGK